METDVQKQYLIKYFTDSLGYREVKANTVASDSLIIEEDLLEFISQTPENKDAFQKLLKKYNRDEKALLRSLITELKGRIRSSQNMALFLNGNKTMTFEGITLHLFYPSGSSVHEDTLFDTNIFSIVQELNHTLRHGGQKLFSFRPDFCIFLNGFYLGYGELKTIISGQNARDKGRDKVITDYGEAATEYLKLAHGNDADRSLRKDFLKVFEKAIHITATDLYDTFVIRDIANQLDELKSEGFSYYQGQAKKAFKPYPFRKQSTEYLNQIQRFEEIAPALYSKKMIEKEILYYNFIERELVAKDGKKEYKHNDGRLICPRPKQKFGVDKIMERVEEFITHEDDPDYFENKLRAQLKHLSEDQRNDLIAKRMKYKNNKDVFSLLLQYAAGFGKSNIIGWAALQLKDLRRDGEYVYDKIMLITDRVQLRDQLDSKMMNMNISKRSYIEAYNKKTFIDALKGNTRVVIVNLQKFGSQIREVLGKDTAQALADQRVVFLIDEIHRSNEGTQNEEMTNLFDELQEGLAGGAKGSKKKNLIIGLTATPSDQTLARYGEFNKYTDVGKIWVPFDAYTMQEAFTDGFILNPIDNIVPVSAKMYFDFPDELLKGLSKTLQPVPSGTSTGIDDEGNKYRIRKKLIYENEDRQEAVAKFIVERLITSTYPSIRGTGKAMLAVTSIPCAIRYKELIDKIYPTIVGRKKEYERFKDVQTYIVYSDSQSHRKCSSMNGGVIEEKVIQNFMLAKNGLMIVVDKLQTGFDEPKLHTLFLDKEISGINAIQTISRVNRTTKNKNDCKIIDFSYNNVNVQNIKEAFEHFSNVVVSDFDPLNTESNLAERFKELTKHLVYIQNIASFKQYKSAPDTNADKLMAVESNFTNYIKTYPDAAQTLKKRYNKYFYWLNLIQYVLDFDQKLADEIFLEFWHKFNNVYNFLRPGEDFDDVKIFFDNRIGIIAPPESKPKKQRQDDDDDETGGGTPYQYDIIAVIVKRNEEEEEREEMIREFEEKIFHFFEYIPTHADGPRLIAKIKASNRVFNSEEIFGEFEKVYKAYIRRNKATLGQFFIKETTDSLHKLFDDYERSVLISNTLN